MNGKRCIVTGSNTGIGKETARELARRGAHVVLACRNRVKAEAARADIADSLTTGAGSVSHRGSVEVGDLDLASLASIRQFAAEQNAIGAPIDILIHNAGVWSTTKRFTEDGFELTFGVNHLGTFLLTHELMPLLQAADAARIVVLSSALHYRGKMRWDDLQFTHRRYRGPAAYNQSKLANVLFTVALARRLKGTGITANAVHPGVVATELARDYPRLVMNIVHRFLLTPARGAVCSLHVATAPELKDVSGEYFEKSRSKKIARAARLTSEQERLWSLSESLLELTPQDA